MADHMETRSIVRWTAYGCTAAIGLTAGAVLLHAFNPQPDPPKIFSIVGIGPFQAVRLNVVNVGGGLRGADEAPSVPCRVQIGFVTTAGEPVKMVQGTILPGHAAFVTLNFAEGASTPRGDADARIRLNVRPVVNVDPNTDCLTAPAAEVFDSLTGRSSLYILPAVQLPAVQLPPGPTVGGV